MPNIFIQNKTQLFDTLIMTGKKKNYGNFFKKKEVWKEEATKLKEYNTAYERIKKSLIGQLGKPLSQDSEPNKTESTSGSGNYLSRNTVWETD